MSFINDLLNALKTISLENIINIGIGIAIILIFEIFSSPFAYIIVKMFKFKVKDKNKIKQNGFYKPLKIFFVLLGIYIATMALKLPENIFNVITKIFKLCTIFTISTGFANLFDFNSETFDKIREKFHVDSSDTIINFFSKIAKFLIYAVGLFIIIAELGYDLSGLITGLGIGSVVIAFAAQDIAKNIIAGISIISDRPFDIGDHIFLNELEGIVEDITFRTTRIRNSKNEIIIIPNSLLTASNIINTKKMRYDLLMTLELNTSLEKVSNLSENIRLLLNKNELIEKDSIRVFFNTVSANGIDVTINFLTNITDLVEFSKFKEEINYTILELVRDNNINLAYPSQSIYLKKD